LEARSRRGRVRASRPQSGRHPRRALRAPGDDAEAARRSNRLTMRSLLFVPGDQPDKMEKALASGADALILDLEDSVAADRKHDARRMVSAFVAKARDMPMRMFVRINDLGSGFAEADLEAVMPSRPGGIVL